MTKAAGRDSQCCGVRGGGGRPRVCLDVCGVRVTALVDTGSTHTLVNSNVYNRLPKLTPLYAAPQIQSITNHELPLRGACTLKIAGIPTEVLVCDTLGVDLLIGANLCRSAVIDFQGGIFQLGDQKFPMTTTQETFCPIMTTTCLPRASSHTINQVLAAYEDVFSDKRTPVNVAQSLQPAVIDTGTVEPIRQRSYRLPFEKRQKAEECIEDMLKDGIIRPSDSPWASPITLVPKKDGSTRFCIDYRKLNQVTRKDAHPLPYIQDIFDQLSGAKIFSLLDLKSGYWQVPMSEESIPKTAFTCHLGLFEFVRMPFGLTNAPAIFQRAMNKVLSGLIGRCCMVYIDDIVIYSKSAKEHAQHLAAVLQRLRETGLQLKPSKCNFGLPEIELLGYKVNAEGIQPLESRVSAIVDLAPPRDTKAVRSFLGMAGYYRQCIPGFATLALPLTELTKPKEPFRWGLREQEAFDKLKDALTKAPILSHPCPNRPYTLYSDASNKSIGAILVQKDDHGIERVITYLSHKLSGTQQKWSTIEKEAYGIIYALKKFHPYLWGAKFEIHTDHKPLKSLFQSEIKNTKLQRWAIQISEYGAPILYHPGKLNIRADMLSRIDAVKPVIQLVPPIFVPDVWKTDNIDPKELSERQHEQFTDAFIEASQDTDETRYFVEDGILYTFAEPSQNAGRYMRVLLPQQYRQQVIDRCHAEVAHAAAGKTLARIQEHYVWPGMRKHVRQYISACVHCNTVTPPNPVHPRGRMPTPPAAFHTWGMDIVGPFHRDQRGRQYLLTCIDHLTGWAEAIPIASKKAETVQQAFMDHIVARYGLPLIIVSDNGGEFTSTGFEKWLREFGVSHHLTSPYNPRSNGMSERFNGVIQRLLLKLTGGNERLWSKYLSEALYAYRITSGPSGMSPYQAVYGKRARLPRASNDDQEEGDRLRAIRLAEKFLHEFRDEQREAYRAGESGRAKRLPPGTFVSVRVLNPKKGQSKWQPGYQVVSSHDGALRVMELKTGNLIRINQQRVREIPESKTYEEVDPLPERNASKDLPPMEAMPIIVDPNPHIPTHVPSAAALAPPPNEWESWCRQVYRRTH